MNGIFGKELEIYEIASTTSTNDRIKKMIVSDKVTLLIAKQQTKGRGKHKRKWISIDGNLYMSIGFASTYERLSRLVFLVAISVGKALKEYPIMYKWPNDLFIGTKKVGGILIENDDNKIIIGIGVNITKAPIESSTCLNNYMEYDIKILPLKIAHSFMYYINYIDDFEYIRELWEEKALFLNQNIEFESNSQIISGKFLGINFDGSLLLKLENGSIKSFHSGSICIT